MPWLAFLAVPAAAAGWFYVVFSELKAQRKNLDAAEACMDMYFEERRRLVPILLSTARNADPDCAGAARAVIRARNAAAVAEQGDGRAAENALETELERFLIFAEKNGRLRADPGFSDAAYRIRAVNDRIGEQRFAYNRAAEKYNAEIRKFPSSIVANVLHFEKRAVYYYQRVKTEEEL